MTVALVANIARPISSAISTAFSADSYGLLSSYGLLGASSNPDAVIEALFANSEVGAWYDPSDLSTMFQDSAGTTPVTADGQTVGKILDKSGRGNHATQATEASRPMLQQDGNGKYYLAFDGVDDGMATAAINFTGTSQVTVVAGLHKNDDTDGTYFAFGDVYSTAGGFLLGKYSFGGAGIQVGVRGTTGEAYEYVDETVGPLNRTMTLLLDLAQPTPNEMELRINGQQAVGEKVDDAGAGPFGNLPLQIGHSADDPRYPPSGPRYYLNGRIYSLIVLGRLATTQEITDTETWVAGKTGVTL